MALWENRQEVILHVWQHWINASGLDVGEHLEKSSRAQAACAWYPPTDLTAFPHDL